MAEPHNDFTQGRASQKAPGKGSAYPPPIYAFPFVRDTLSQDAIKMTYEAGGGGGPQTTLKTRKTKQSKINKNDLLEIQN